MNHDVPVEIVEVARRVERRRFLKLPDRLAGDPRAVRAAEIAALLDPLKNPLLRHTDVWLYLAVRDGRVAGRIALLLDVVREAVPGGSRPRPARFALLDAETEPRVVRALVEACAEEARRRGYDRLLGPAALAPLDPPGLLGGDAATETAMPVAPPLVIAGGARHSHLLLAAGLRPVRTAGLLEVALVDSAASSRSVRRSRRSAIGLGARAPDEALTTVAAALAAACATAAGTASIDLDERRAGRLRLARLAVPELCLRIGPPGAAAALAYVAGFAHARDHRRAHARVVSPRLLGRLTRRRAAAPSILHLVVALPPAPPRALRDLVAPCLIRPLERARDLGYDHAAVSVLAGGALAPADHAVLVDARAALDAAGSGGAVLREVVLYGREIAR